ncbi:hypothetical protein RN001_000084 [Aquatica leii]|uniref:Uncharacterized protein n=1 Tax=Aquatica leii TaxID=1421715 RepID=A0AAN7SQF8_9COLE|nr:hypothetical protein RN001_000084 [Aquatica leii]
MGVLPNLRHQEWYFSKEPIEVGTVEQVQTRTALASAEQTRLQAVIDELGCTMLAEHVIIAKSPPIKQRLSYFDAKKKVDTMVTPSTSFAQVATAPARIPIQAVQAIGPEIKSIDVKELERELLPRLVDALKAVFALRKDSTEEVTSTKLTLNINRENKKRKDDQRTPPEEKGCIEGSQPFFSQQKDTNMVKKPRCWPKGKTRKPRDESQDSLRSRSTSRESTHKGE